MRIKIAFVVLFTAWSHSGPGSMELAIPSTATAATNATIIRSAQLSKEPTAAASAEPPGKS